VVNMRDLGSPVHAKAFFRSMFRHFPDQTKFLMVRDGGIPVGGAVCCFFKDTMMVPWASSLRSAFSKCPNNLLYWEAIKYGCKHGLKRFDFGRSSKDSNTYRFKAQWGARPVQLYWVYYSQSSKPMPAPSLDTQNYSLIAEAWKKLPVPFTRLIGPQIRKYISI
jgi:serine/alanine adding enzyme